MTQRDGLRSLIAGVEEQFRSRSIQAPSVAIGTRGYSEDVDRRAQSLAGHQLEYARQRMPAGLFDGHDENELHDRSLRRARSSVRTSDPESANPVRAYGQQAHAVADLTNSMIQMTTASNGQSSSLRKDVSAVESFTNSLMNAHAAMGPTGVALAVLGSELVLLQQTYEATEETNRAYWNSIAADAARAQNRAGRDVLRHYQQATQMATAVPYTGDLTQSIQDFDAQQERESRIRDYEAGNHSPQLKANFRQRTQQRGQLLATDQAAEKEIAFREQELANLKAADQAMLKEKENFKSAWRNAQSTGNTAIAKAIEETPGGTASRYAYNIGHTLSHAVGYQSDIDQPTGLWKSQIAAQESAILKRDETQHNALQSVKRIQQQIQQNKQQEFQISQRIAQLESRRLTTTKALQQSAYEAVQSERERVKSGNIAFGSASLAQQSIALRLQGKHERIEAQRAANKAAGRPEDEGVEQFSQWELQQNTFGGIASISMRRQAEAQARQKGFKFETDLEDREADLKAENAKPLATRREAASQAAGEAQAAAKAIGETIRKGFPLDEFIASVQRAMEELRAEFREKQMQRNRFQ